MKTYRGLTWDHPRGYNALAAAARKLDGLTVIWDKQPLEGFESHPIEDLASRYDLIVLDHPHIGEAVARGCLIPLDGIFGAQEIRDWEAHSVGRSFASYRYAGACWALPLDAATQVMAYRRDLLGEAIPESWDQVMALSPKTSLCLSLAGPHAILTFFSMACALGEPPASRDPDRLVSPETGRAALDLMDRLHRHSLPETRGLNPIGILDLMATTDRLALCPAVYGYVNYATAKPFSVSFANAPLAGSGGRHGSTLGGTGIAISRRCDPNESLLDHLRWLMGDEAQMGFIPSHDGQPGTLPAWCDPAVNRLHGNFFADTVATLQDAWVRPRYDGYIAFQSEASALLREGLEAKAGHDGLLARLQEGYARSRRGSPEI